MMRVAPLLAVFVIAGACLCPSAALAKRAAPKPVAPVILDGVEYRAPVRDMGYLEAIDVVSKQRLWRSKVYSVMYMPLAEKDCQDIFIVSLGIKGGNLLVRNEAGRSYRVDLKTGHVLGGARYWVPCAAISFVLFSIGFFALKRM
jgi:hypothetical protein